LALPLPRDSLSREQDLKYARGHKNGGRIHAEVKVLLSIGFETLDRGNYPSIGLRPFAVFQVLHASSCLV
jgi:hypothetical protein